MPDKKIVIAIDGYSSCGKSTLAKSLAGKLGYTFIDSGAMYRAVTLYALRNSMIQDGTVDTKAVIEAIKDINITFIFNPVTLQNTTWLNGENVEEEIRKLDVSEYVSPVSAIREVRQAMVHQQQEMGKRKGVIMDGRDIGTVVFPEAELKIFMTADPEVRAQRRFLELTGKGMQVNIDDIRKNIEHRDHYDQTREESPLRKAEDALVLDNSLLTHDQQLQWALEQALLKIDPDEN